MARKAAAKVDEEAKPAQEPEPVITEPVEVEVGEAEAAPEPTTVETVTPEAAEPAPVAEETAPPPAPPAEDISRRLEEMERAEQLARQQNEQLQRQLAEAQRNQRQASQQTWQAQYEGLVNTLGATQSRIDAATQELEQALASVSEGDPAARKRVAELNVDLGKLGAQLGDLERRKEWADGEIEKAKRQRQQQRQQPQAQPQQPRQQPLTAEQVIAQSGLPERAQTWLRQHPDYVTDPAKNAKIQEMHHVAKYQAGAEWTDGYFEKMEELLGFKPAAKSNGGTVQPQPQRQAAQVSAPPTREAPSMTTGRTADPTKTILSAAEQDIAYETRPDKNMTRAQANVLYAKNKLKLQKMKANGEIS